MRRGDVYEYVIGSQRVRILIVSADPYNPNLASFAVVRGQTAVAPPRNITVETREGDPVRGVADLARLRPLDPSATRTRLGRMTNTTMERVDLALRTYLGML